MSRLQPCMICSSVSLERLYTQHPGALLILISIFSGHSLFPFWLFQLHWIFRSEAYKVYYLSFSTLFEAATVVCPQEKAKTWEIHHITVSFSKFILLSKIYLLFFLRRHEGSFCIFFQSFYLLSSGELLC